MHIDSYVSERQKKRRKRRAYFLGAVGILIIYFILAGIAWFIFRSPLFRFDHITVKGNSTVPTDAVVSLMQSSALRDGSVIDAFLGFRNMLIWPGRLSDDDMKFIPVLKSVTIEKDYFSHSITVTVTERDPFAIWCLMPRSAGGAAPGNEACYSIDDEGVVFERSFDTQGSLLFAVHDYTQQKLGLNANVLPGSFSVNVVSIVDVLRKSALKVKEAALKDLSLEEIDVTTYDGPSFYFSLRFPASNDLPVIQNIMSQKGFAKLQYVDCRTENRVYYK